MSDIVTLIVDFAVSFAAGMGAMWILTKPDKSVSGEKPEGEGKEGDRQ